MNSTRIIYVCQLTTGYTKTRPIDTGAEWDSVDSARWTRNQRLTEGFKPEEIRIVKRTIIDEVVE